MPVCFSHLWKELILGGSSTEHTCCWLHLKASLLTSSHSYKQTNMERSSSCVHAGELLKFPICPLRKPPQLCFLGEKIMFCGNTSATGRPGWAWHVTMQTPTVWPKSCETKCLAFLLTHLGFQGLCTWVQIFVLCQHGNSFLFHFQVVFTWHFKFLCFSW